MTLMAVLATLAYFVMAGASFRVLGNYTNNPSEPWETPGPFFGALLWPALMPAIVGYNLSLLIVGDGMGTRTDRRRSKEIEEAEHQMRLAEIRHKETELLERALS